MYDIPSNMFWTDYIEGYIYRGGSKVFMALKYPGEIKTFFVSFLYKMVVKRKNEHLNLQDN
jgi:hypothetical protein